MNKSDQRAALRRLSWRRDVLPLPEARALYHVASGTYRPTTPLRPHTHDFAELFWIERGTGVHHINGTRVRLGAGDMVFIRPADVHAFEGIAPDGLTLLNIAMPVSLVQEIRARFFDGSKSDPVLPPWPWREGGQPLSVRLTPACLDRLREWAGRLGSMRQSRLEIEAFLLDLLCQLDRGAAHRRRWENRFPGWLLEALAQFERPGYIAGGASCLAALAGRSPEHVCRTVRRLVGMSTTELINEIRLDHVQRQLRLTSRSILEIAMDCGFESPSYLHRRFRRRFGMTPRAYRRSQHLPLGAAEGREAGQRRNSAG